MKIEFIKELKKIARKDKKIFFLTGDLGFRAFEEIRDSLGERFINAGIAEQNMTSVAAGLCKTGLKPWVYSISTFLTLKTVEQVRNDICHMNLSVKLAGFGGGYGYGIMGESHHLLEDIAIYSTFPHMKLFIPAFVEDIPEVIGKMYKNNLPSYLRLNLVPKSAVKLGSYSPIRKLADGKKATVVTLGPLIHAAMDALNSLNNKNFADVFSVSELPITNMQVILESVKKTKNIIIIEEHSGIGGLGEKILSSFASKTGFAKNIIHLFAKGYISGLYGNHAFHQKENSLDSGSILKKLRIIIQ